MPKVVDHERRRLELAEAVWRVVLRDGVEGVSVRAVAREAGLSAGALRHYFGTKEEMLVSAAALLERRVRARLEWRAGGASVRERVLAALGEVLPLDEERRTEGRVWFAYASRSLVDPEVARRHAIVFRGVREMCSAVVGGLDRAGLLAAGLEADRETVRLHALLDGLVVHGLLGAIDEGEILAALERHVDEMLAPSGGSG